MAQLQHELRSAAPLRFVSLSLDPLGDSPERLRDFAAPFAPGPRWSWLTGEPDAVYEMLEAMRADPGGEPSTHAPLWLVGRAGRGPWKRVYGMPDVARFQALIDRLQ